MLAFLKREIVFAIAFSLALISTILIRPSATSLVSVIDYRTLILLFSLMGISEGLKKSGFISALSQNLGKRVHGTRSLSFLLIIMVFIVSMFLTNDVALLLLVPFTMRMFSKVDEKYLITLVVLETIAANLGSMTLPVGNPQNLYITSYFEASPEEFFKTILPYSIFSFFLVILFTFALLRKDEKMESDASFVSVDRKMSASYLLFLALALLSVFHLLDYKILFIAEITFILFFDRKVFSGIDYFLLLTFVSFFIFSGNIRSIGWINRLLTENLNAHPMALSLFLSECISNVPAAIVLSPFAENMEGILIGTDLGGLGTPIASLASLISMKIYFQKKEARKGTYILIFLALNTIFLFSLVLQNIILTL